MTPLHASLAALFDELIDGPSPQAAAYMLNSGDAGLLRSLETLPAHAASATPPSSGATIAAHVDHICYGLELMNRWAGGEADPWSDADWSASWRRTTVSDEEWAALRERLAGQSRLWHQALQTPREMSEVELNGVIGSVGHLAYHLGAIRQIDRSIKGPSAT